MSWEVSIMKSRTSCFNPAIAKNLLRRFWPLWLAYFLLLLLIPLSLFNRLRSYRIGLDMTPGLNFQLASYGEMMLFLSLIAGLLAAMAVFGFLYQNRSCGLMTSLPVTRTCLFFTCFCTGLLALLGTDLIVMLLTALFCLAGYLNVGTLLASFGVLMLSTVFFYGFACFCAMLTGNLLVLPLVYFLLNFAAIVIDQNTRFVLCKLLYGMSSGISRLVFLSPLAYMVHKHNVVYVEWPERVQVLGLGTVAVYAAIGVVFALLAWGLFQKRRMETAGDTVALRVLKPVFIYCMAFGAAIVLTNVLFDLLNITLNGRPAAILLLLMLLLGALIGYFAARMLVEKSFRVFRGHWRGYLITAAVIVLLVAACEWDVFGYETRVPKLEEIESVSFGDVHELSEPETIEAVLKMHQNLIEHKDWHETAANSRGEYVSSTEDGYQISRNLYLSYQLKNGKTVWRGYRVFGTNKEMESPASDLVQMEELFNLPECMKKRCATVYPMTPENVVQAYLHVERGDASGAIRQDNTRLEPEELLDLWANGVLPDLAENHFGRCSFFGTNGTWEKTDVGLTFMLVEDAESFYRAGGNAEQTEWHDYQIGADAVHTIAWIREHTGIEPEPTDLTMYGIG